VEHTIGIDTGGTFTDVTVVASGRISFYKALTTPGRLDGVFNALQNAAEGLGVTLGDLLQNTTRWWSVPMRSGRDCWPPRGLGTRWSFAAP
jgi:hypothetical protein